MADESTMGERMSQRGDEVVQALDRLEHRMNVGFDRMDANFRLVAESFDGLREHMDRRFDAMEERHDKRMSLLEDVLIQHSRQLAQKPPRQR